MVKKCFLFKLKNQRKLTKVSQALGSMFKCIGVARVLVASSEDTKIDAQVVVAKLSSNTGRSKLAHIGITSGCRVAGQDRPAG